MNLYDRPADNVPTRASNLGDIAVFMRNRTGRTKNNVMHTLLEIAKRPQMLTAFHSVAIG